MIYLIGGPARDGKSTLAKRVRKEIDGMAIAGDAFVKCLQGVLRPEWMPELFAANSDDSNRSKTAEAILGRVRTRDEAMWVFYRHYVEETVKVSGDDLLIEGCIWPDLLASLGVDHRAVFLIDTSTDDRRLRQIRDDETVEHNWMREQSDYYTDEELVEWAKFNALRARRYRDLCLEHGYTYFDIAEGGIGKAEDAAFEYLLKKEV